MGKQVEVKACVIKENGGSSIRLKCPKRVINMLGIPERGLITVHIMVIRLLLPMGLQAQV
jgi:hypothetical protein